MFNLIEFVRIVFGNGYPEEAIVDSAYSGRWLISASWGEKPGYQFKVAYVGKGRIRAGIWDTAGRGSWSVWVSDYCIEREEIRCLDRDEVVGYIV